MPGRAHAHLPQAAVKTGPLPDQTWIGKDHQMRVQRWNLHSDRALPRLRCGGNLEAPGEFGNSERSELWNEFRTEIAKRAHERTLELLGPGEPVRPPNDLSGTRATVVLIGAQGIFRAI